MGPSTQSPSWPIGARVSAADRGHGSFLTIELDALDGTPYRKKATGYLLWIYLADWAITINGTRLLDSGELDSATYEKVLKRFLGTKLLNASPHAKEDAIFFEYENGCRIDVRANLIAYEKSDDLFMLFDEEKRKIWSLSPDKGLYAEPLD